ncbi:MAG: serine/threonine protein kinase [Myxococcota bacterium]
MAYRPPRRDALATPERTLPDFGGADDQHRTDIVPTPLRLLENNARAGEARYTICGEFQYGGLPDVHLAFVEGADGFRRTVVVQRLSSAGRSGTPILSPDALLGCHTRHPNVIPVLDLIESDGEHLLVLEYVISATLSRLLFDGNRMPLHVSSAIVSGVLHALDAAHTAMDADQAPLEIVHAGVAPDTVLVGVDGTARLIHFGQAKHGSQRGGPRGRARNGYVSPEQVFDQRADARSDVFSAGVLLWECLSGRPLLEGGSAVDAMLRFISRPAPRASSFNPRVPAALDAVLSRALEPTPERRFRSAAEFAGELEAILEPAAREEVARYVEGVAWSSIHEQRLFLRGPDEDDEPTPQALVSQLWDRTEPQVPTASGPRAAFEPEDPTIQRFYVNPNLGELKIDWQSSEADELTKVEGLRPASKPVPTAAAQLRAAPTPAPVSAAPASARAATSVRALPTPVQAPLADASFDSEPPLNLAPAPTPRFIPGLPRDVAPGVLPPFRSTNRWLPWALWGLFGVSVITLSFAFGRTQYGRELHQRISAALSGASQAERPVTQTTQAESKPTPLPVPPPAAAAPPAQTAVATPAPTTAASLRVLSLEELPVASSSVPAEPPSEPRDSKRKRKRDRKAH